MFKIDLKMTPLQYRAETWPTHSGHHTEHFGICHHFGKILDSIFLALCNRLFFPCEFRASWRLRMATLYLVTGYFQLRKIQFSR